MPRCRYRASSSGRSSTSARTVLSFEARAERSATGSRHRVTQSQSSDVGQDVDETIVDVELAQTLDQIEHLLPSLGVQTEAGCREHQIGP